MNPRSLVGHWSFVRMKQQKIVHEIFSPHRSPSCTIVISAAGGVSGDTTIKVSVPVRAIGNVGVTVSIFDLIIEQGINKPDITEANLAPDRIKDGNRTNQNRLRDP